MKRIGILTSGGDAPGMNATIRAVLRRSLSLGIETVGIRRGYDGLIDGDFLTMSVGSVGTSSIAEGQFSTLLDRRGSCNLKAKILRLFA